MQATIDRIEGGIAVLITCGENPVRISIPANLLPHKSQEGDSVSIVITLDTSATDAARKRIAQKIERLSDF